MAYTARKRGPGHKERGQAITQAELDQIAILIKAGLSATRIAELTGRGRSTVYKVISERRADQIPLDLEVVQ